GFLLLRSRRGHVRRQGGRTIAGLGTAARATSLHARPARLHAPDRRNQAPPSRAGTRGGVGSMPAALAVTGLEVVFDRYRALKGVTLSVQPGESFGLVGESGSGKSTLLRAIAGLAPVTAGTITVNGKQLGRRRDKAFYRQVQMVFQDPYVSLHPRHTVD